MRLADLLHADRITTSLEANEKNGVLQELARLFSRTQPALDPEAVFRVLAQREALASTGVGSGVAIPHGRIAELGEMQAALGMHRRGVAFDAVDGRPVYIVVAVLAPERRPSEHLKALARISRLLRDENVRARLLEASDSGSIMRLVLESDERG